MQASPLIVTIRTERESPRLRYVLDWLLMERLGLEYRITQDKAEATAATHDISYGFQEGTISIHATTLLWETEVVQHDIPQAEWQGLYALYFDETSPCDLQFDMLAGIFFLLSRYEEHLPFSPDRHGRFPAERSLLFAALERPVVDEWVEAFRVFLEQVWNVSVPRKPCSFRPTYDIDIAWSYKNKGLRRTLGAALKDAAGGNISRVGERMRVLRGRKDDPYDSFVFLMTQHMMDTMRPLFFILAALKPSAFDKNISPRHPRMQSLIKGLDEAAQIGMHPSYYSDTLPDRFKEEKTTLEAIIGAGITQSRQHYIRLKLPDTYVTLLQAGITDDWSMGYSTHLGFRAGTGSSFFWYNLKAEKLSGLRVHPFAFMDSTAHFDMRLSAGEAFGKLRAMTASVQSCGSSLVTIMHNFSLGSDKEWAGWRDEYVRFLNEAAGRAIHR